jgi:hypothetical protein
MLQREAPLAGVLFSFRSSTNLHDVLAREDVLSSGASVGESSWQPRRRNRRNRVLILHLADKFGRTLPRWAWTPFGGIKK